MKGFQRRLPCFVSETVTVPSGQTFLSVIAVVVVWVPSADVVVVVTVWCAGSVVCLTEEWSA